MTSSLIPNRLESDKAQASHLMLKKRLNLWLAVFIALASFLPLFLTLEGPGFTWDEAIYTGFSFRYVEWLKSLFTSPHKALSPKTIQRSWGWGTVHPPLAKVLSGLSLQFLFSSRGYLAALRMSSAILFTLLVVVMFIWVRSEFGLVAGLASSVSLILMPRFFGHAHLGTLDLPLAFFYFLAVVLFARALKRGTNFRLLGRIFAVLPCGIGLGLALLTKINAVFLPLVLWPWAIIYYRKKALLPIISSAIIGPLIFILGWPWLWHQTLFRTYAYFADKASRVPIAVFYLAAVFKEHPAPWHYPLVMTSLTIPFGLLCAMVLGVVLCARGVKKSAAKGLLISNALLLLAVASLPFVPKYDGVRLFLPLFPFLAIFCGLAIGWIWEKMKARGVAVRRLVAVGIIIFFATQAWGLIHIAPFWLSYYNLLAGGLKGGYEKGLEATYWGDSIDREVFDFLETQEPGTLAYAPVGLELAYNSKVIGLIGADFEIVDFKEPHRYLVLVNRQGMFDHRMRKIFQEERPIFVRECDGVPLTLVYERKPDH